MSTLLKNLVTELGRGLSRRRSTGEPPPPAVRQSFPVIDERFIHTFTYRDKCIRFFIPEPTALWRAATLLTKEPDTIAWIDSFQSNAAFIDIGANIGVYSLWAELTRQARVTAFEPEAQSFAVLNRNILLNQLSDMITAYCLSVSDTTAFDRLYVREDHASASGHSFGTEVSYDMKPMKSVHRQGSISFSLDELISQGFIPFPDHIKIDIDGFEHKVIAGARHTLANPALKSVLVELNTRLAEHREAAEGLLAMGFEYHPDPAGHLPATTEPAAMTGQGNFLFIRPPSEPQAGTPP